MLEYLFEIGVSKPAGMGGDVAIDHTDIACWQFNTNIRLKQWEARAIRQLSRAYCVQLDQSTKPHAPPPYRRQPELTAEHRKLVEERLEAAFDRKPAKRK